MRVAMCEIYPESAPEDWILRLRHWHIPAACSPLHDKDTYDSDKFYYEYQRDQDGNVLLDEEGEAVPECDEDGIPIKTIVHLKGDIKKAHYHLMLVYGNATTAKTFFKIIKDIGGVVPPWEHMEVVSVPSMFRYFAHLDDPDKFQYDINDCVLFGGFDPVNYETYMEKNAPFNDVLKVLREHPEITDYRSLAYYYKGKDTKMFYFVMNHTLALKGIFGSSHYLENKGTKEQKHIV